MIDEIYIAKRVEYSSSGGSIFGLTPVNEVAGTVLCFMIASLAGCYKDTVGMYPINTLNTCKLDSTCTNVLELLDSIGFNVVAISTDNHPVNRSFFINVLCDGELRPQIENPVNGKPLFLIFDPVHNIKNVYNNFQTRKKFECPSFDSEKTCGFTARFNDIKELYTLESTKAIKLAFRLMLKSLEPKAIEKTSMRLAMSIFCESTMNALSYYSEHSSRDWGGTATFVNLILKLWKVINVKTATAGQHKRDSARDPIVSTSDWKLTFLQKFEVFLKKWQSSDGQGLSKETFLALIHMCKVLPLISKYLIQDCGFKYVLLGKLQSDNIESRFGWYRQLSGANYFISMKQLLESESKIKTVSLLKFSGITVDSLDEPTGKKMTTDIDKSLIQLLNHKVRSVELELGDANAVYYVAGALARSQLRQRACESCTDTLVDGKHLIFLDENCVDVVNEEVKMFLEQVNRGGLLSPSSFSYNVCLISYKVFTVITTTAQLKTLFLQECSQKNFFISVVMALFTVEAPLENWLPHSTACSEGHNVTESLVGRFFNCMMKNFVKEFQVPAVNSRKRKIAKLSGKTQ